MESAPLLTLFSLPKPMAGEAERLQRNAFSSWQRLLPQIEVLLIGDEPGIQDAAAEFGFQHIPNVKRNSQHTPLLNDAFVQAKTQSRAAILAYFNADILIGADLLRTVSALKECGKNRFLAIGRRWESQLVDSIEDWSEDKLQEWLTLQRQSAPSASVVCKDYFVFPRHLYSEIPAFAVGRGNWDNWMVYHAHRTGTPVVDITYGFTAVHQPHGHRHSGGRLNAYVSGEEAKENQRLAGGRHLIVGSHANYWLDSQLRLNHLGWQLPGRVAGDIPRFLKLLATFRGS